MDVRQSLTDAAPAWKTLALEEREGGGGRLFAFNLFGANFQKRAPAMPTLSFPLDLSSLGRA